MPGSQIYSPSGLIDCARGVIPTVTEFDVDPTDLANCTDGSLDTCTGEGTKTLAAAGDVGELHLTLPQNGIYLVGGKFRTRRVSGDAGSIAILTHAKTNGVNWSKIGHVRSGLSSDGVGNILSTIVSGTTFKFEFYCSDANGADVFGITTYSVWAYKLG